MRRRFVITILAIVACMAAVPTLAETPDEIYTFATHLQEDQLW